MIFIAVGTQRFPFDRLLKTIDDQIKRGQINEKVVAQIGYSKYKPKYYKAYDFLPAKQFTRYIQNCDLLITHGGVGTILKGKKYHKTVIVVPRLAKYHEHVDDHQLEIAEDFNKEKLVVLCTNCNCLYQLVNKKDKFKLEDYTTNNVNFIKRLNGIINEL